MLRNPTPDDESWIPADRFKKLEEREAALQSLLEEHRRMNAEWAELSSKESKILTEGALDFGAMEEIHNLRLQIVDRLWELEQKILELSRKSE